MNTFLCDTEKKAGLTARASADMDLIRLAAYFIPADPSKSGGDIENFLFEYLTYDCGEIRRRSEILGGLRSCPDNEARVASVVYEWKRLAASLAEIKRSNRPLMSYTMKRRTLESYIASVGYMESILASADVTAFPVLREIAATVSEHKSSALYSCAEEGLRKADKLVKPLKSLTLAVNMSGNGQPLQIGIADINKSDKPSGIFGGNDANSLCSAAPVKLRSQVAHLETYIMGQVEKRMFIQLNMALRELSKIDYRAIERWLEWLKPIELYQAGLLYSKLLDEKDCTACRPEPGKGETEAVDMLYPHMLLASRGPARQSLRITAGEAIMITGANNSGKTSAMKAFSQNCVLAQLGFPVPAASFRFAPFKSWHTVFSAGEDGKLRASRYQQEAEWTREAAAAAAEGDCVLLNEPFTSTNPSEAAGLLCDIVTSLLEKNATVMIVTHIFDLYGLLCENGVKRLRSYVTGSDVKCGEMAHTYLLEEKEPDGLSHARLLAKEYGLDIVSLVKDAETARILEDFVAGGARDDKAF